MNGRPLSYVIYVIENGFSFIGELIIDGLVKGDFVIFLLVLG